VSTTVLLINRCLAYNCGGKVRGLSGAEYGNSVYEEAFGAHVCRMPLSEWRVCRRDVVDGGSHPMSRWEVDFDTDESPAGGEDVLARIRDASPSQFQAIVSGLSPVVQAAVAKQQQIDATPAPEPAPSTFKDSKSPVAPHRPAGGKYTEESLAGVTKYFALLKIAREVRVESPDRFDSTPALRKAILERQAQPV